MKLNVFFEDDKDREIEIVLLKDAILQVRQLTQNNFHTIIHGPQIWGWDREYDAHVFINEPSPDAVSRVISLFPAQNGNKTQIYKNSIYETAP